MTLVRLQRNWLTKAGVRFRKGVQEVPDKHMKELPKSAVIVKEKEVKPEVDGVTALHTADGERAASDAITKATEEAEAAIAGADAGAALEKRARELEKAEKPKPKRGRPPKDKEKK